MTDKTETISIRVTPEMREDLNQWCEENGYSEAEGVRELIRRAIQGQETLEEIKGHDEIMKRLECIEKEIKEIDTSLWGQLFPQE